MQQKHFITGNQAIVYGAKALGASCFCGYPITPATEILEEWAKLNDMNPIKYKFIQSEDETSAGFNTIGAILAGAKAFTATAGPGHILMQDPLSMAEAMRIPLVTVVMQRGGPSTGTVIYSQQEVTLACFGGNGEGLRIVYSIANPQEAYDYIIKAFIVAWKYRFPTIILGDGYISKMQDVVYLNKLRTQVKSQSFFNYSRNPKNIRNCYNIESQLANNLNKDIIDFENSSIKIVESQKYNCSGAKIILVAHGIVSQSAKLAIDLLKKENINVGLFRPITLRPFDYKTLSRLSVNADKIIILESSNGHFARLVKEKLYSKVKIETFFKPVEAISVEEIIKLIK